MAGPADEAALSARTSALIMVLLGGALATAVAVVAAWPESASTYGHVLMLAIFVPLLFAVVAVARVMDASLRVRNRTIMASARAWVIVVVLAVGVFALDYALEPFLQGFDPVPSLVFWLGFIILICGASLVAADQTFGLHIVGAAVMLLVASLGMGLGGLRDELATLVGAAAVLGAFLVPGLSLALRGKRA